MFYYWNSQATATDKYASIKGLVRQIYDRHKGRYGYRRITVSLRKRGHLINHKAVQRLMGQLGLKSTARPKRYKSYRGVVGHIAPNRLAREFSADSPAEKWVTDVTEFNVNGEKIYLSPMLDVFKKLSRKFECLCGSTYRDCLTNSSLMQDKYLPSLLRQVWIVAV